MVITNELTLDMTNFIEGMERSGRIHTEFTEKLEAGARKNPIAGYTQKQEGFNKALGQQVQIYQRVQASAESFRNEQKRLEAQYTDLKSRQMEFLAAGRYAELRTQIGLVREKLREMNSPLVEADSLWDRLKAKFSKGIFVPPVEVPVKTRDERGRFLPGQGGSGGGGGNKPSKSRNDLLKELGLSVLDEAGGAAGLQLSGGQLAIAGAVAAGGAAAVKATKEWAEYGAKLSEVSAITGLTGKDLAFLDQQAQQIEIDTGMAGTVILDAFKSIGSIKPELLESKELLAQTTKEVITLSQASGLALPEAAKALLGSLNQFNEGADQAARFSNVLAAGAKLGASEINETADALQNSGTAMKAAGLSFEQGNALIQSLAGVMIKGSEAGTGLRNVLLKLETDTDKNLRPSIVGLDKALENAAGKYKTTTELTKVFGVENIVAARRVLDTREEISKLTKDITGTSIAYEQARTSTDNLATDLQKAGTAINSFFRNLGQSNDGFLRGLVQRFTSTVNEIGSKTGVLKTFISSYVNNTQDGLIGALFTAGRDANRQRQANLDQAKQKAEIDGIVKASTLGVADDTKVLTDLYEKQGQAVPKAQRAAAAKVKEQNDAYYADAVANHARLRREFEKATTDQKGYYDKQFAESRRQILRTQTAKKVADAEVSRLAKADAERAKALATALGEPPAEADKKAGKAREKAAQDTYKLLLSAQEEYVKEYQKIENEFGKDRLEALKKDENAYIREKANLDKQELENQRQHLQKMLQLASSNRTQINKLTGQREIVPNAAVRLPADVQKQFDDAKQAIDVEAERKIRINRIRQERELLELGKQSNDQEVALFDKKWEEILASEKEGSAKYLALIRKRDAERNDLLFDQIIRDQKAIETIANYNVDLRRKPDTETGTQFNRRNELDKIANGILSAESQVEALRGQQNIANTPEIKRLEAYIKVLKEKRKEIEMLQPANRDIWDVLGISKSFTDETERQIFLQAVDQISAAVRNATEIAVQASEERIQALDALIQEKEEQVRVEEERDKEGAANNLKLRRAELEELKRQKAEEQAVRRRALAVQQSLDLAAQISNNAVTVSNTVTAISEMFKQYGKIPFVGIILAIGAVATILSTIASVKAKARALTQLRKGGRVPVNGRTHEQGGHRIEGTDIEVERGEHVTNAQSSERFDKTLEALNQNNPLEAFLNLVREGGLGVPDFLVQQLKQPAGITSTMDTRALESKIDALGNELRAIKQNTKPRKQVTGLGGNKVLEIEEGRETVRIIK
ncbi:hypothetical protein GGR92_005220 [Spirosoma lacussanchae]|uniref:phage tail tape measure protein n=1 Tax=Spirosoma lacussanchae TaxID=1884249 RepID=UPI001107F196|nr:phage tail tape measure protein [Spirosoma lacussanchae]